MTSEYQKMIAGEVYRPSDPELRDLAQASRQKQSAFNKEEDPLRSEERRGGKECGDECRSRWSPYH